MWVFYFKILNQTSKKNYPNSEVQIIFLYHLFITKDSTHQNKLK